MWNRGDGQSALKYLTPYISRVALSTRRLVSMQDGNVTFSYTLHNAGWKTMTLPAFQFLSRFLQHVLPKSFQKIRYYGLRHPSANGRFQTLKQSLEDNILDPRDWPAPDGGTRLEGSEDNKHSPGHPGVCPHCGGDLRYVGRILRIRPGMLPMAYQRGPPTRKEGTPS